MSVNNTNGFTLIELLTVIAIMIMLASFVMPIYGNLQAETTLSDSKEQAIQAIRRAQNLSCSGKDDMNHGVYFDISDSGSDNIVIFSGTSYASREADKDAIIPLENSVALTGNFSGNELVFSKYACLPDRTGEISLSSKLVNRSANISVNSLGIASE